MKEQSSQSRPDHRNVREKIGGDRPTEMGEGGSHRDHVVFQVSPRRESAQRTQSVRRARRQRDGGFPRAFPQGSVSQGGLPRFVHFHLHWGSEAVSYLVRLGAHKVSTMPPRGRCSLSCTLSSSRTDRRLVAFKGSTKHNEGSNPKTGRARDPINKKTSRRGKFL